MRLEAMGDLLKGQVDFKSLTLKLQIELSLRNQGYLLETLHAMHDSDVDRTPVRITLEAIREKISLFPEVDVDQYDESEDAVDVEDYREFPNAEEAPETESAGPSFIRARDFYEGTAFPLYEIRAEMTKDQLAEAAFQANLPNCVIKLVSSVARGDQIIEQAREYHWTGDSIRRITSAAKHQWLKAHQMDVDPLTGEVAM